MARSWFSAPNANAEYPAYFVKIGWDTTRVVEQTISFTLLLPANYDGMFRYSFFGSDKRERTRYWYAFHKAQQLLSRSIGNAEQEDWRQLNLSILYLFVIRPLGRSWLKPSSFYTHPVLSATLYPKHHFSLPQRHISITRKNLLILSISSSLTMSTPTNTAAYFLSANPPRLEVKSAPYTTPGPHERCGLQRMRQLIRCCCTSTTKHTM